MKVCTDNKMSKKDRLTRAEQLAFAPREVFGDLGPPENPTRADSN